MIPYLGYAAAVLTTFAFLPQTLKTIRTRDLSGISFLMYLMFTLGVICWFIYAMFTKDLPLFFANGIATIFSTIILSFKIVSILKQKRAGKKTQAL